MSKGKGVGWLSGCQKHLSIRQELIYLLDDSKKANILKEVTGPASTFFMEICI